MKIQYYYPFKLNQIARKIWWGKYPRNDEQKWADAPSVGVNMRWADFPETPSNRWVKISDDFEMMIESGIRGEFRGRFHVRRVGTGK